MSATPTGLLGRAQVLQHLFVGLEDEIRGFLYVGIDGGMIFVDKRWQEVMLACVFAAEKRVEVGKKKRGKILARTTIAVRGDPQALKEQLEQRAEELGALDRRVVVLGDGARWIWALAKELFLERVEILDWYHADEHVSGAASLLWRQSCGHFSLRGQ
jgi:hypothetical protein